VIFEHEGYQLDDDPGRIDSEAAWEFLSTDAYWGRERTRDDFEAQLKSAWRVVGVYEAGGGRMIGFARAFSDGVAAAYLADVYVLPEARGHGLGKELVRTMIDRGPGAGFRWMLHTRDAHGLYRQFGFAEPGDRFLERLKRGLHYGEIKTARHPAEIRASRLVVRYITVREQAEQSPRLRRGHRCLDHRVCRGGVRRIPGHLVEDASGRGADGTRDGRRRTARRGASAAVRRCRRAA
jgi:GNAT superfamily N-acetyltransferase